MRTCVLKTDFFADKEFFVHVCVLKAYVCVKVYFCVVGNFSVVVVVVVNV